MGPGDLEKALANLPIYTDSNLIAGLEHSEDAGVYRLHDDLALVQTLDFFTPIVDDPRLFGQIATANALSDVYAKGGRPVTALNIVCFPLGRLDIAVLREILRGSADKLREAQVVLLGGHSVTDEELKFGLSITGIIHPGKVIRNRGCQVGDRLVLTKPLGTGIMSAAHKLGEAPAAFLEECLTSMLALNRVASESMLAVGGIHAATDVTGFGLAGHAAEMVEGDEVGVVIDSSRLPFFPGVRNLAEAGLVPGGLERNRSFREKMVERGSRCPGWLWDLCFDPQTSGGLLVSIAPEVVPEFLSRLRRAGAVGVAVIGEVIADRPGRILVI